MTRERILVIKHGALGDIVIATAGFAAIRETFPHAHITLLTSKPYAELLAASPYFNEVWVDGKAPLRDTKAIRRMRTMLNSQAWDWVFDLQGSTRSTAYQWLLRRPWPKLNNISRWSSHGYRDPKRMSRHALRRLQLQLQAAGIEAGQPDVAWLRADIAGLAPQAPLKYALLVPGGAPHRPEKRWPAEQFAALAHEIAARGTVPLLIGTKAEEEVLGEIAARVPEAVNLGGRTSIAQIAELARGASFAVGNDTGPMHVIAATGCPSTVIFSYASDPALSAPTGQVTTLREKNLENLSVDAVLAGLPGL